MGEMLAVSWEGHAAELANCKDSEIEQTLDVPHTRALLRQLTWMVGHCRKRGR